MKLLKTINFAFKTIKSNKMRLIIVIIGLVIALSLIISVFFWANTSERIILNEFVENTDYLFYTSSFSPKFAFQIFDYLKNNTLVENFDLSVQSYALFNIGSKNDSYRFYPFNSQEDPDDPVVVSNTILSNISAMHEHLSKVFAINGEWPDRYNEIVLTDRALERIRGVVDSDLKIGSEIDISIGRRVPFVDNGDNQLAAYKKIDFTNYTITGIINYKEGVGSIKDAYPEESLEDLIIFPIENLVTDDLELMDINGIRISAMVQFYMDYIYDVGINNLNVLYGRLSDQIKSRYWTAIAHSLLKESLELKEVFNFSFNSVYYYIPLLFLSLLLSDQASSILLNDREKQIDIIRKKGATNNDLSIMMSLEFILIAIIGTIIGLPISIVLSAFIPAVNKDGSIDLNKFTTHLNFIELDFAAIYLALITIIGIFIVSSLVKINHIVNPETFLAKINRSNLHYNLELNKIEENNKRKPLIKRISGIFNKEYQMNRSQIVRLVLTVIITSVVLVLVYDINIENDILEVSQDPNFRFVLTLILILFNLLWIFYFQYLSNLVFALLDRLSTLIKKISPETSFLVIKNLTNKRDRTKILVFYIIFILTLITMSSTLIAIYEKNESETDLFLQGADLRIATKNTFKNFSTTLENIPGIEAVTPIHHSIGRIVGKVLTVYAVEPKSYLDIAYWDEAQVNGTIQNVLPRLELDSQYNILISTEIATRLHYEIGDLLFLSGYQNTLIFNLTVQGIIDTAPGLGIASSPNPEVDQETAGWVIIPLELAQRRFDINIIELFLGKVSENANL
ncbi:MAG: FtsX-like permease family protein, partial [Candidatus Heimdallarchaeota archaeon]|nr:FtsX-like permease family protein [Candidatus Heimdallarchaeota archaeon]